MFLKTKNRRYLLSIVVQTRLSMSNKKIRPTSTIKLKYNVGGRKLDKLYYPFLWDDKKNQKTYIF